MTGIQYYFAVFTWPFTCLGLTRSTLPFSNFNPGKNQDSMTGKNQDSMTLICLLYRIVNFHGQIFLFYILSYKFLVILEKSQKKKLLVMYHVFLFLFFIYLWMLCTMILKHERPRSRGLCIENVTWLTLYLCSTQILKQNYDPFNQVSSSCMSTTISNYINNNNNVELINLFHIDPSNIYIPCLRLLNENVNYFLTSYHTLNWYINGLLDWLSTL